MSYRDQRTHGHHSMKHALGALGVSLALLAAGSGPARAQKFSFNPELLLGTTYNDNPSYVTSEGDEISDTNATAQVVLPLNRVLEKGNVGFSVSGAYAKYKDLDTLDHWEYAANAGLSVRTGRSGSLAVSGGYARTQSQGDPAGEGDAGFFLSRRTDRETVGVSLNYETKVGAHWQLGTALVGSRSSFDEIERAEDLPDDAQLLEDRSAYSGEFLFERILSRKTTLGGFVGYRWFDLDNSGEETVQSVGVSYGRAFGQHLRLGLRVGAFDRSQDLPAGAADDVRLRETGLDARVSVDYDREIKGMRMGVEVGTAPSAGGALQGTSTNATAAFLLSREDERAQWNWDVAARYTRRESSDRDLPTVETYSLGGSVERRFGRQIALRGGATVADQSSDMGGVDEGSFYSVNLAFAWYPRGRSFAAGAAWR